MRPATLIPLLTLYLILVPGEATAQTSLCGIEPFPPFGCHYYCVCRDDAPECHWQVVCDGRD